MCVTFILCVYVLKFTAVPLVSTILKLMAEQVNSEFLFESFLEKLWRMDICKQKNVSFVIDL